MRKLVIRTTACCVLSTCLITGGAKLSFAKDTPVALPTVGIANVLGDYCTTDSKLPSAGVTLTLDEYAVTTIDTDIINSVSKVSEEYRSLVIAQVDGYVNVRAEASVEAEVVGKLYNNAAATILGEKGEWYKVTSGNVIGYVRKDCVVEGEEAQNVGQSVGKRIATAAQSLQVYAAMDASSQVLYEVEANETMQVLEEMDSFIRVAYAGGEGYVIKDAVSMTTRFASAETLEEEQARIAEEEAKAKAEAEAAAQKAREEQEAKEAAAAAAQAAKQREEEVRRQEQQQTAAQQSNSTQTSASDDTYTEESSDNYVEESTSKQETSAPSESYSSKGQQIADYALQFVGNPYKWGGTSLTNGADCSGFVMSVMSDCGIGVAGRTASAQSQGGTSISGSDLQPGDLVFYASGGRVSHVAIYIGDGQIVHAANSRKGIIVSSYNYQSPYKYVRYY